MAAKKKDRKIAYCVGLLPQAEVARKQNGTDQRRPPHLQYSGRPSLRGSRDIYFQAGL